MIEVLGDIRVDVGGQPLVIGSRSQRLVLAVLAAHANRVVGADTLIDALWEDDPPETARRTLGSYVSRLRAVVGDSVEIVHGGYRLDADGETLDVFQFEEHLDRAARVGPALAIELLERALGLVRGAAFGEFAEVDAVRPAAVLVESLTMDAREARAGALIRVGRSADAAAAATELVSMSPLREAAWTVLIDAQSRSAPGEALRSYRRAVSALADAGLVPSDELRAAESRALLGEGRPDPVGAASPTVPSGTLIGRSDELVELGMLLQTHRVITLVGPGGVGKTRLAQELASRHHGEFRLGSHMISLDEVSEPDAVAAAVIEELGRGGVTVDHDLELARIGGLDVLLIIDNCEHLIDAAAGTIEKILEGGDAARIVATSRQRIGVDDERVWTTPPLTSRTGSGTTFGIELFVQRADALGIDVTGDRELVEQVVERLDGLPLAIEMAAALLSSHGLADLEMMTRTDLAALRAPRRGAPRRQRSLGDLVDWSLDGLDDATRHGLATLSTFEGTFDRSSGASMVGEGFDAMVHDVVERSLLSADTTADSARYRMLWTIKSRVHRRAGDERMAASRRRHVDHHLDLLVDGDRALRSADERIADRRLSDAYADLRSAHLWAAEHDERTAASITRHLHVWAMSRQVGDPFRWAERLITDTKTAPPAALAARTQAWFYSGFVDDAIELAEATLERAEGIDRMLLLESLGDIVLAGGDLDRAIRLGNELADTAERQDDVHFVVMGRCGQALAHGYAGNTALGFDVIADLDAASPTDRGWIDFTLAELSAKDESDRAARHLHAAIVHADSVHNRFLAGVARVSLAALRAEQGDPTKSVDDLVSTIEHWHQRGMHAYLLTSLRNLVVLLDRLDETSLAARLIGAIDGAARVPSFGTEQLLLTRAEDRVRGRLGDSAYLELRDRARASPFDETIVEIIDELRQRS